MFDKIHVFRGRIHLNDIKRNPGRGKEVIFGLIKFLVKPLYIFARYWFWKICFPELDFLDTSTPPPPPPKKVTGTSTINFQKSHSIKNGFKDFKRIERLLKIVNYPDLFDTKNFNNYIINEMKIYNLEM